MRSHLLRRLIVIIVIKLLLISPLFAQQAQQTQTLSGKIVFVGAGIDPQSGPNGLGFAGFAFPIASKTIWINDWDASRLPGATLLQVVQASGLEVTFRSGVAQQVFSYKSLSLWGMVNIGASFGPGTIPAGTPAVRTPTDIAAEFAYGGFADITIHKNLGAALFLQNEKDAAPNGFRFAPRLALRCKF